jgi:hypothetical protein
VLESGSAKLRRCCADWGESMPSLLIERHPISGNSILKLRRKGCVHPPPVEDSGELWIQKNKLCDIGIVGLQLHWIRLVAGRVTAAIAKIKRSLEVLILCVI